MKIFNIIIFLHGSKKKNWFKNFLKIKKNFFKKNYLINNIEISWIKSKKNFLIKIINNNYIKKIKKYIIIPIFLLKGVHLKKDIKKLIKNILLIFKKIKIFFSKKINNYKNLNNYIKNFLYIKIKKIKNFLK